jgi:hypothetical protein
MDCEDKPDTHFATITDEHRQSCAAADGITAPDAALLRDRAATAHKAVIQSAIKAEAGDHWDLDDYCAFYDQVTGTLLSEGLSKPKAEAFAFECCVLEWLNRTFEPSPPGRCVYCVHGERIADALLPLGTESAGRAWLYKGCRDVWHANRRAKGLHVAGRLRDQPSRPACRDRGSHRDSPGEAVKTGRRLTHRRCRIEYGKPILFTTCLCVSALQPPSRVTIRRRSSTFACTLL